MRILVVDDEPLNRFLLIHMLEENGYTDCIEAETGEQALELAEQSPPDLVLLDVLMPGMSGFEAAPKLKEKQQGVYLPIIFITSLDDDASLARGLHAGGDDFVSKPFNKVVLAAKLKAHARTRFLSKQALEQNEQLLYHQRHIEREHAIVEHIFDNVLNINPALTRFVDYHLAPASNFNGDMVLIERSPNAGLYMLLGDFTGHGLASAIGAIPVSRAFHAMSEKGVPVGEIAATMNDILLDFLPDGMFFACAILEVSENGRTIELWNGGLPHLMQIGKDADIKARFQSQHMALGILEKDEFDSETLRFDLDEGDSLLGYTDGVIELENEDGQMLGEDGLEAWVQDSADITSQHIMEKIESYRASSEQADDITMLIYRVQTLGLKRKISTLPKTDFNVSVSLNAGDFATANPVADMVDLLSGHESFHGVRSNIFTVLSEIYNNALDHGLLCLDSKLKDEPEGFLAYFEQREERLSTISEGNITLHACYSANPPCLMFRVKDSGTGFDFDKIISAVDSEHSFGRGIGLIQELTDKVSYEDDGRCVTLWFVLDKSRCGEGQLPDFPKL